MDSSELTSALVTYGLISAANKDALTDWFNTLFTQVQEGGGGELLASTVAGRSFTFGGGITTHTAFVSCSRALNILNGRTVRSSIARF